LLAALSGRAGALLACRSETRPGPALSLLILLALAGLAALLLAVAAAPRVTQRRQALAVAGICLAGAVLDLVFLAAGAEAASLHLPAGLPGFGATLSLDPLAGLFLLPMLAGAGACCLGGVEPAGRRGRGTGVRGTAGLPCCLAVLLLTCLAGDAFTLLLAATTLPAAMALCRPAPALPPRAGQDAVLGPAVATALCLAVAVALLVPSPGLPARPVFAAIRAHPPEGWRATAVLACSLLGTVRLCGLWLHSGQGAAAPQAYAGTPGQDATGAAATLAAAVPLAGLYVLTRLLLDLCGPATPLWWGVPVLAAGSAAVAAGGLRAATAARMEEIVEAVLAGASGLAVAGLGVALLGRGADLPLLAALALGGVGLLVLAQGPLVALLALGTAAVGAIGVAPPLVLSLAGSAVRQISFAVPEGAASAAWTVSPLRDGAGYAALPLAGLVAAAAAALAWAMRRRMARGVVERPGWEGGFAAPPPWLPFGDPATQLGPQAIDAPLLRLAAGLGMSQERTGDPGRDGTGMGDTADGGAGAGLAAAPAGLRERRGAALRDAALAALHGAARCEVWMGGAPLPWLVGTVAALLGLLVWAAA